MGRLFFCGEGGSEGVGSQIKNLLSISVSAFCLLVIHIFSFRLLSHDKVKLKFDTMQFRLTKFSVKFSIFWRITVLTRGFQGL